MRKREIRNGLLLFGLHTLASGVLQVLVLVGPRSTKSFFVDFYWALESWSGTFFDRLLNSAGVVWAMDSVYQLTGTSPYLAGVAVRASLVLIFGGAFFFAVGFIGTSLAQSGLGWIRRRRPLPPI